RSGPAEACHGTMSDDDAGTRLDQKLLDALRERPVVFDGAMGTALYERGVLFTNNFDHQTLKKPDLVRSIHQAYFDAGAEVFHTNTCGANRYRPASHELTDQVEAINRAAVKLAREAARGRAWVAGSIGPSGTIFKTVPESEKEGLRAATREQAAVLAEEGVD